MGFCFLLLLTLFFMCITKDYLIVEVLDCFLFTLLWRHSPEQQINLNVKILINQRSLHKLLRLKSLILTPSTDQTLKTTISYSLELYSTYSKIKIQLYYYQLLEPLLFTNTSSAFTHNLSLSHRSSYESRASFCRCQISMQFYIFRTSNTNTLPSLALAPTLCPAAFQHTSKMPPVPL